jgi:hypothetical protein
VLLSAGVGVIDAPALLVQFAFSDLSNRKKWDQLFDSSEMIEMIDEVCKTTYYFSFIVYFFFFAVLLSAFSNR